MRWGMVIDLVKCVGCYGCVVKCKQVHFLPPGMQWGRIVIGETGTHQNVTKHMYPVLCNHCREPACVKACPTGATEQREDGIVEVHQDECVGCRYCMMACPYQARSYSEGATELFPGQGLTEYEKKGRELYPLEDGVVVKCNFCVERVDEGLKRGLKPGEDREATPACANICSTKARVFGDLDDPDSEINRIIREGRAVPLHSEYGTEPCVYYIID